MRYLICLVLLALASTVSAGSIRPAAVITTAEEDAGIKFFLRTMNHAACVREGLPKNCTDAEIKAKNPDAIVRPTTAAGYQDYLTEIVTSTIRDHAAQGNTGRIAKQLPEEFLAASPADQQKVLDALPGLK